tara:strand:- start:21 stop:581 length:561 start_codon:yes stop_codon:yes gene_type:complete
MYDHVIDKNIFPTFICSCIPQIDMMSVMEECYMIKNQYDPVESSNEGGYHSPRFQEEDKFAQLVETTKEFANDVLHIKNLNLQVKNLYYWCNINKCYNYNVMHSHGRSDLIGIYYVQVPPGSGNLHVLRNDGSQYCDLYENRADMLEYVIEPEMGRLYILPGHLWHYVTGSNSDTDRVSVSFNIYT